MNKKLCVGLLYLFSNNIFASSNADYPDDLKVSIQNLGSTNCQLSEKLIITGNLYESTIPTVIPCDAQSYYFTITGLPISEIALTYACGADKTIKLHIKQYYKRKHIHTSIETDADVTNMHEKHSSEVTFHNNDGGYTDAGHLYPGKVMWQFFD